MNLFDNKDEMNNLINIVSENTNYPPSVIEKDYYSILFLKKLIEFDNNIIFKGGTSLSKCFRIIKRYSEDLDLNYVGKVTPSKRKKLKEKIKEIAEELNLTISNIEKTRSRRDFNKYLIDYNPIYKNNSLKENIIIEVALQIPSFPFVEKECNTYIYDYLKSIDRNDVIEKYELEPFKIKVQSLERTFVDKVFALGDYYLDNKSERNSRHLYDLSKIKELIDINSIDDLIEEVRALRKEKPVCYSCKDGINMQNILTEIIESNFYKKDYENISSKLIESNEYDKYKYDKVIGILKELKMF